MTEVCISTDFIRIAAEAMLTSFYVGNTHNHSCRNELSSLCTESIYELMKQCWQENPGIYASTFHLERPTFAELLIQFQKLEH